MIEFLRQSDLDVKSKYFFIVMAYHSSRPNEGAGSTLETIIKRIGFSKSAARKAIKELHNARIIDLDYSLNEKMTSRCELERFKSFFLDLPDFLINYIDSDSIRKKTIDTEKNNNTSVVNKDNLSFQEFVCSFYIWVAKNKETGFCLIPYKEIGDVINGSYQTVRRVLNKISIIKVKDLDRFIVMLVKGRKTKSYGMLTFCVINPILISKGDFIAITSKHEGHFFLRFPKKCKTNYIVRDFIEFETGNGKIINGFLGVIINKILNVIFNNSSVGNIYGDMGVDIITFKGIIFDNLLRSILNLTNNDELENVICIVSLLAVAYILSTHLHKAVNGVSPDKNYKFHFLCNENMYLKLLVIDAGEGEDCSFKFDFKRDAHIRRINVVNALINDLLKLITVE